MLESVLEPVFFRCEANQYAGWTTMAGDHNLLTGRQPKVP